MRLTQYEIVSIKKTFLEVFKHGSIYLFGSRVDDTKKGGDIDLFIVLNYKLSIDNILDKRKKFKISLYDKIGEQKIDVIIAKDKTRPIEQEVRRTWVEL
ncbi:MAG: nucleotidyltransferase domain-containing protein [Sulfurospirillum sp.]|nr:nucleotidyltransferase domain-containing protein [Sulfurospirillum sp.]MBL0703299.1 nucleotidyltransferase domain-containing protein [Sulfurospirillum sp.]